MFGLKYLEEFKSQLADYKISAEAKRLIEDTTYVSLTAITASGRNTIVNELLKSGKYYFVVSDTTRPPRVNNGILEQNGKEYWFRTEEEVLADVKAGSYIEAAVIHNQQVSGQNIKEIKKAHDQGLIAISEFEVQGVETIRQSTNEFISIFVLPPSYKVWRQRWSKRGKISETEQANRIKSAQNELKHALSKDYYHFLINDDLAKSVSGIEKIIAGQIDPKHEIEGKRVAQEILKELENNDINPR